MRELKYDDITAAAVRPSLFHSIFQLTQIQNQIQIATLKRAEYLRLEPKPSRF